MTMKQIKRTRQGGFGVLPLLLILLVAGGLAAGGWFVWQKNRQTAQTTSNTNTTANQTPADKPAQNKDGYQVPAGFTVYENPKLGFKFAYPKAWGTLQPKEASPALFAAATTEMSSSETSYISGKVDLIVSPIEKFEYPARYQGPFVKPVKSGEAFTWKITNPGIWRDTLKVGDTLDPQPKAIAHNGNVHVYEFPKSHACGEWTSFVFAVGANFVGVGFPAICTMMAKNEAASEKAHAEYQNTIKQIAHSIRGI